MATNLVFTGTIKSETQDSALTVFCNFRREIYLEIKVPDFDKHSICFDKETAIKLSKELRKQIAYIDKEYNDTE